MRKALQPYLPIVLLAISSCLQRTAIYCRKFLINRFGVGSWVAFEGAVLLVLAGASSTTSETAANIVDMPVDLLDEILELRISICGNLMIR